MGNKRGSSQLTAHSFDQALSPGFVNGNGEACCHIEGRKCGTRRYLEDLVAGVPCKSSQATFIPKDKAHRTGQICFPE